MKLTKKDLRWCKELSAELLIPKEEIKKAVVSYFDSIISEARKLPFDNPRRIYSASAFNQYPFCVNIPYLGRLGSFYSLYRKWRAKEAKELQTVLRKAAKKDHTKPLVEQAAKLALSGQKVDCSLLKGRLPSGKYTTVWLVDRDNKRKAAKQMIVRNSKI